jgi:EmrB/QacA subfamily drug resistance transporter
MWTHRSHFTSYFPISEVSPVSAVPGPSSRLKWLILVIACMAQFMVVLDNTIVNVALPSIQRGLSFSITNLQWIVNGYTLTFGGFLMLGGRMADLLGRRRLFVAGVTLFSVASLLNGLAQDPTWLIFGRGLQGIGGAMVSPAALSIIMTTFQDNKERTQALGIWSAIAAGGAAFGLVLGGVLTDLVSWRWCFFVNVPVGALTIAMAYRSIPESTADLGHRRFDAAGAATITGGLLAVVFAIVKSTLWGWGSPKTLGVLAGGIALLVLFYVIETRSPAPLIKLSIFRIRSIATANLSMLLVASALFGMFYFASLYVQDVMHYSALRAGFAFLPTSIGIIIGAGLSQGIIPRIGVRNVSVIGMALACAGLLYLTQLPVLHAHYAANLLPGLLGLSIGLGLVFVPLTLLGTSGVNNDDAGLASGLFNSAQQVGGSLGLAILATLSASHANALIKGGTSQVAATVSGYHIAFLTAAIMMGAAAVIMTLFLRKRHVEELDLDPAQVLVAA